jgi:hypothetical protein
MHKRIMKTKAMVPPMTAPIIMAVFDFLEDLPVPFTEPVRRFGFPPYLVIRVQIAQF